MMTSSNGSIFRVTGSLCGEFTGHRWIPRTKASDAGLWCFFDLRLNKPLSKQSWGWWFEKLSHSLWRHCYVIKLHVLWVTSLLNLVYLQGLYSLSGETSYRQISWSLEAARLTVIRIVSLWNLTGIAAALLRRWQSNFKAIGKD